MQYYLGDNHPKLLHNQYHDADKWVTKEAWDQELWYWSSYPGTFWVQHKGLIKIPNKTISETSENSLSWTVGPLLYVWSMETIEHIIN